MNELEVNAAITNFILHTKEFFNLIKKSGLYSEFLLHKTMQN